MRESSSEGRTWGAWGRVDWPPMSMMVAPELMKFERVVLRDEGAREWRPPSEKESGVRLRTAMMRVWRVGRME